MNNRFFRKLYFVSLLGWLSAAGLVAAAESDWRLVPGRLTTTWGDQVTPDNAWRE